MSVLYICRYHMSVCARMWICMFAHRVLMCGWKGGGRTVGLAKPGKRGGRTVCLAKPCKGGGRTCLGLLASAAGSSRFAGFRVKTYAWKAAHCIASCGLHTGACLLLCMLGSVSGIVSQHPQVLPSRLAQQDLLSVSNPEPSDTNKSICAHICCQICVCWPWSFYTGMLRHWVESTGKRQ